jgi:hypothetical protein
MKHKEKFLFCCYEIIYKRANIESKQENKSNNTNKDEKIFFVVSICKIHKMKRKRRRSQKEERGVSAAKDKNKR